MAISHGAAWLYAAGINNHGQLGIHEKRPNRTDSEEELQLVDLVNFAQKYGDERATLIFADFAGSNFRQVSQQGRTKAQYRGVIPSPFRP